MTRRFSFAVSLLAVLQVARPALALKAVLESIDGSAVDADNYLPLNKDQCDRNAEIKYEITNDKSADYLAVMIGTDCNEDRTDVADDNCVLLVGDSIDKVAKAGVYFSAKDLDCADTPGPNKKIYFLGLSSQADQKKGSADSDLDEFKIDTVVPRVPTKAKGGKGEHSIEVTWSYDDADVEEFRVYYEVVKNCPDDSVLCAFSGDDCGSGSASGEGDDAGADDEDELPGASESKADYETASGSSRSLTLVDKVEVGENAAVAVAAIDEAGNSSLLSNVACITGISTVGFCELNEKLGGSCESGCSVGRPGAFLEGGAESVAFALAVGFGLMALIFYARRRST